MKRMAILSAAMLALSAAGLRADLTDADPNIEDANNDAWAENIGWTTWEYTISELDEGVVIGLRYMTGYVWAENVGWINLGDGSPENGFTYENDSATDFGVNVVDSDGTLEGYAWGENIGWVNFGSGYATFDYATQEFEGHLWGENVGWINLDDATYFVGMDDISCTCLDLDGGGGAADAGDLDVFELCYQKTAPDSVCCVEDLWCSDLNDDFVVDQRDLLIISYELGESSPTCNALGNLSCASW